MPLKKFTVKDFITYNNPCFSCGSKISFNFAFKSNDNSGLLPSYIRSTVTPERTEIDLKITYSNTLQLWIFHKSNKILSSDMRGLTDYLAGHKLFMTSRCDKCYTAITSDNLEFNLAKGFIKPVTLSHEAITLTDDKYIYTLSNHFTQDCSRLTIQRINKATPIAPLMFDLPLTALYKFNDREHFINKMKTFIVFS
jgi:hypothetical protein